MGIMRMADPMMRRFGLHGQGLGQRGPGDVAVTKNHCPSLSQNVPNMSRFQASFPHGLHALRAGNPATNIRLAVKK